MRLMRCRTVVPGSSPRANSDKVSRRLRRQLPTAASKTDKRFSCSVGIQRRSESCNTVIACMARSPLVVWRLPEEKKAVPCMHGFTAILRANLLKENRLVREFEGKPQAPGAIEAAWADMACPPCTCYE